MAHKLRCSFACLLLTGDCSRNSKSYRWYLESRQGFENRGISNALKIERPHSRSEWAIDRWGHVLIRILGVFFRSSGDGAVMLSCFALTPHYLLLVKAMVPEGALMISKWHEEKMWGGGTRHSEAFWSKPGKETRKTGWSSDSIEKKSPFDSFFARSGERRFEG